MSTLFDPITVGGLTLVNRAWLSPMCQYSCVNQDGIPGDWHLVHLGARASGGFGLLLTEAAAVVPEGRISPQDAGIWNEDQVRAWRRIVDFVHERGASIGVQLAHAGRKASTYSPFAGAEGTVPPSEGGWETLGPSAVAFPGYHPPREMDEGDIARIPVAFAEAAERAARAGFDALEVHAAHGYLLHEFLSPHSNLRTDAYGGDFEGRTRLLLDVVEAVRSRWAGALFVRISATDWTDEGWTLADSRRLAPLLAARGVDLVDVSSGGNVIADIPVGPGYQVALAQGVREAGIAVGAVGLITGPDQAEDILSRGQADVVFLARAALREPAWPQRAGHELGEPAGALRYPPQYARGAWRT